MLTIWIEICRVSTLQEMDVAITECHNKGLQTKWNKEHGYINHIPGVYVVYAH